MSMPVPLEVPPPATSRQSPDWTPTMVPLDFTVHFWLAPPVHVQRSTGVPGAVPAPETSRHSVAPFTRSSPAAVGVHSWLAPPLQVQISAFPPVPDAGTALISATPPGGTFLAV